MVSEETGDAGEAPAGMEAADARAPAAAPAAQDYARACEILGLAGAFDREDLDIAYAVQLERAGAGGDEAPPARAAEMSVRWMPCCGRRAGKNKGYYVEATVLGVVPKARGADHLSDDREEVGRSVSSPGRRRGESRGTRHSGCEDAFGGSGLSKRPRRSSGRRARDSATDMRAVLCNRMPAAFPGRRLRARSRRRLRRSSQSVRRASGASVISTKCWFRGLLPLPCASFSSTAVEE